MLGIMDEDKLETEYNPNIIQCLKCSSVDSDVQPGWGFSALTETCWWALALSRRSWAGGRSRLRERVWHLLVKELH